MSVTDILRTTTPKPSPLLDEYRWADDLAAYLAYRVSTGRRTAVTWFNHVSIMRSIEAGVDVARFDFVGVDGILLRRLAAPRAPRTSADLVLPRLLSQLPGCRVALIGSDRVALENATAVIESLPSRPSVVLSCDGYSELVAPAEMAARLRDVRADVVVLGLGAPLQDSYLLALLDNGVTGRLLITCGGWIDQVSRSDYYPPYAYRLRINWLFRVLREPARLWRRYTVEGVRAIVRRDALRHHLLGNGARPFAAMTAACGPGQGTSTAGSHTNAAA